MTIRIWKNQRIWKFQTTLPDCKYITRTMWKVNLSDLTKREFAAIQEEVSDEPRSQGKQPRKQKAPPKKEMPRPPVSTPKPKRPIRMTKLLRTLPQSSITTRQNTTSNKRQFEELKEPPQLPSQKRTCRRDVEVFEYFCKLCDRKYATKAPVVAHVRNTHCNELFYVKKRESQEHIQNNEENITQSGVNVSTSGSVLNLNDLSLNQLQDEDPNSTKNLPPVVNRKLQVQIKQEMIDIGKANLELKNASNRTEVHSVNEISNKLEVKTLKTELQIKKPASIVLIPEIKTIPTKQILFSLPSTSTLQGQPSKIVQGQGKSLKYNKIILKTPKSDNRTPSIKNLSWKVTKINGCNWYGCFHCDKQFKSTDEIVQHSLNTHLMPHKPKIGLKYIGNFKETSVVKLSPELKITRLNQSQAPAVEKKPDLQVVQKLSKSAPKFAFKPITQASLPLNIQTAISLGKIVMHQISPKLIVVKKSDQEQKTNQTNPMADDQKIKADQNVNAASVKNWEISIPSSQVMLSTIYKPKIASNCGQKASKVLPK